MHRDRRTRRSGLALAPALGGYGARAFGGEAPLLLDVDLDVNVEDLRLEHSPGAQFGLAEISVAPGVVHRCVDGLQARGWKIASTTHD